MTQSVQLLVDVGNSRIKYNCLSSTEREFHHASHAFEWGIEKLDGLLDQHWEPLQEFITQVYVSNVAGNRVQALVNKWCTEHWNVEPQFAQTAPAFANIKIGYDDYRELGVDRWLSVIAAHYLYSTTANIVIDSGSATTIDTVLPSGEHRAGPILSENRELLQSLLSNASGSGSISDRPLMPAEIQEGDSSSQVFVTNTKNAILSGVKFAVPDALEQIISQIENQLITKDTGLVITGGAAQNLMRLSTLSTTDSPTQRHVFLEPDLVLKGLAIYYGVYDSTE